MKPRSLKRRTFIRNSVALSGLLVIPDALAHHILAPQPKVLIRRNIATMGPDDPDLKAYKTAVRKMKDLPKADPRHWENQAKLHENFCPHQNWFFLPWHRAYLYYFEAICRELSGYKDFALPYWNWTESRVIPVPFWGADNPLNNKRRAREDSQADPHNEFVAKSIIDNILSINDFETFASSKSIGQRDPASSGQLEFGPHNYIHNFVGGDMVTFMSPMDPVFWCHHANVDRIWAHWNDLSHQNSSDTTWLSHQFKEFHGTPKSIKISELLDTSKLLYRYDTQKKTLATMTLISAFKVTDLGLTFKANNEKIAALNSPLSVPIEVSNDFLRTALDLAEVNKSDPKELDQEVNLIIDDIRVPKDESILVRVFINCDYLSKDTPVDDPHYVATFTFFASDHIDHSSHHNSTEPATLTYKLRLTNALTKLLEEDQFPKGQIKAQLLTLPLFGETSEPGILSSNFRVEVIKK